MSSLLRAALAATLLFIAPASAHNGVVHLGPIDISAPFSRATLPNAPVGGGYMTIENTGSEEDRLIAAQSPVAADVEIHEMKMEGDIMKMRRLDNGLAIPAGGTIVLAPGGAHIMFMGLKEPIVEGEVITVTLTFEKAGTVDVELPVLGAAAEQATHHMSH